MKKKKHFFRPTSRRKTDWEQFLRFVSFHPFRFSFRFRSHLNTNTKKDQSGTPFAFLEKKKKIPPLVRRLDHQTIEYFVFFCLLSVLFLCSFQFFLWIYVYRYVYVIDQFDTPFFFLSFRPLLRVFFGEGREVGVSSLLRVVGWLVVEGKRERKVKQIESIEQNLRGTGLE